MSCRIDDQVDEARSGAELVVRMAEPVGQHAIFGHAVEHAVRADDGRVHRARQNQRAHQHDESVEQQAHGHGADQEHREAADQVVQKLRPRRVRNDHHREERNQRREQQAVDENHEAGALQVLQLGMRDLAVDLRQAFLAAHGQQRVSQADQDRDHGDRRRQRAFQPAQGVIAEMQVRQAPAAAPAGSRS